MSPTDLPAFVAIDTAGPVVGVAALRGDQLVQRTERAGRGTETRLMPWARAQLEELGATPHDLAAVGVTVGPGAFTGLRVGLAAGVGLAVARRVPMWAEGSLSTRAARAGQGTGRVLSVLDARKGKVYACLFSEAGEVVEPVADLPPEAVAAWLRPGDRVVGEGAVVFADHWTAAGAQIVAEPDDPAVDVLVRHTAAAWHEGSLVAATSVQPRYVRAPDAKPPKHVLAARGKTLDGR